MVTSLAEQSVAARPRAVVRGTLGRGDLQELQKATGLMSSGRFEDALELYRRLAERSGRDRQVDFLVLQGVALSRLHRYEEAEAVVARALILQPSDPPTLSLYGALLTQLGRHGEAIRTLKKAHDLDPTDIDTRFNLALALARAGKHKQAVILIDEVPATDTPEALIDLRRKIVEDQLRRLVRSGFASWSGGKPKGARPRVELDLGRPLSDYVVENRR